MPANIASCCTWDMHVHFHLSFHCPLPGLLGRPWSRWRLLADFPLGDNLVEKTDEPYRNFVRVGGRSSWVWVTDPPVEPLLPDQYMYMYVCVCMCMYLYVYVYVYVYVYICICICICICVCVCVCVCMCMCMCICICVCICMYLYVYVCIYLCSLYMCPHSKMSSKNSSFTSIRSWFSHLAGLLAIDNQLRQLSWVQDWQSRNVTGKICKKTGGFWWDGEKTLWRLGENVTTCPKTWWKWPWWFLSKQNKRFFNLVCFLLGNGTFWIHLSAKNPLKPWAWDHPLQRFGQVLLWRTPRQSIWTWLPIIPTNQPSNTPAETMVDVGNKFRDHRMWVFDLWRMGLIIPVCNWGWYNFQLSTHPKKWWSTNHLAADGAETRRGF